MEREAVRARDRAVKCPSVANAQTRRSGPEEEKEAAEEKDLQPQQQKTAKEKTLHSRDGENGESAYASFSSVGQRSEGDRLRARASARRKRLTETCALRLEAVCSSSSCSSSSSLTTTSARLRAIQTPPPSSSERPTLFDDPNETPKATSPIDKKNRLEEEEEAAAAAAGEREEVLCVSSPSAGKNRDSGDNRKRCFSDFQTTTTTTFNSRKSAEEHKTHSCIDPSATHLHSPDPSQEALVELRKRFCEALRFTGFAAIGFLSPLLYHGFVHSPPTHKQQSPFWPACLPNLFSLLFRVLGLLPGIIHTNPAPLLLQYLLLSVMLWNAIVVLCLRRPLCLRLAGKKPPMTSNLSSSSSSMTSLLFGSVSPSTSWAAVLPPSASLGARGLSLACRALQLTQSCKMILQHFGFVLLCFCTSHFLLVFLAASQLMAAIRLDAVKQHILFPEQDNPALFSPALSSTCDCTLVSLRHRLLQSSRLSSIHHQIAATTAPDNYLPSSLAPPSVSESWLGLCWTRQLMLALFRMLSAASAACASMGRFLTLSVWADYSSSSIPDENPATVIADPSPPYAGDSLVS